MDQVAVDSDARHCDASVLIFDCGWWFDGLRASPDGIEVDLLDIFDIQHCVADVVTVESQKLRDWAALLLHWRLEGDDHVAFLHYMSRKLSISGLQVRESEVFEAHP